MAKRVIKPSNQKPEEVNFGPVVNKILTEKYRLKCKNEAQKEYARIISEYEITIAYGPSGTGKSFVSIARAIELLQNVSNNYTRIIISKPAVEADEKLGFMPGTEREKLEPHISSSLDIFDKIVGKYNRTRLEERECLIIQPLGFIRGKSIDNAIIIIEEAQNLSPSQCKAILTRIGTNSKLILSGDLDQSDRYKNVRDSGLFDIIMKHQNIPEIGFFEFKNADIVRNPLISKILNNYPTEDVEKLSKELKGEKPKSEPKKQLLTENKDVTVIKSLEQIKPKKQTLLEKIKIFLSEKFEW
jgi:phosphate starvation-inducible protein PhoH and related proteins